MKKIILTLILLFASELPLKGEPVTMMLLAPVALKVAKDASPHIISGLRGAGDHMVAIVNNFGDIIKLPWGVIQATAGAPLGYFGDGMNNIFNGICAPFSLVVNIITLPFAFTGG